MIPTGNFADIEFIQNLTKVLSEKKFSVSHLNTRDLLRRDYKQYYLHLPWVCSRTAIHAGLSTVPIDLKQWIPRDPKGFWSASKQWMEEKGLAVLGILTSFRQEKGPRKSGGKHIRQMLWVIRAGADLFEASESPDNGSNSVTSEPTEVDADLLASRLWNGLQESKLLRLKKCELDKFGTSEKDVDASMRVRVYKQGNADATRKTTAPLMRSFLEGKSVGIEREL
jgi:exopolyphosphatase